MLNFKETLALLSHGVAEIVQLLLLREHLCVLCPLWRFWCLTLAVRCTFGMGRRCLWHRGRSPSSWLSICGTAPSTIQTVTSTHWTQESATHSYQSMEAYSNLLIFNKQLAGQVHDAVPFPESI